MSNQDSTVAQSIAQLREQLAKHPQETAPLIRLADALIDSHQPHEAQQLYEKAIAAAPEDPATAGAYDGMAAILQERGELDQAVAFSKTAARLQADADNALSLGLTMEQLGRGDDAVEMFRLALSLRPDFAEAHHKLAGHLRVRGSTEESIKHYRASVEAAPQNAEMLCNFANALWLADRDDEALNNIRKAIELKPDLAEAHNVMGQIWLDRKRPSDALQSFGRAIQLRNDFSEPYNNLARVLEQVGRVTDAAGILERAISLRPDIADYHEGLGKNLLLRGQLERGWEEFDWRRLKPGNPAGRAFRQPTWDGSNLHGKTILLHAEQDTSDTLLFARYAGIARDRGGRVILECQPQLVELLRNTEGVSEVIALGQPLPAFDVQCPLLSVPLAVRTALETVPRRVPYITADAAISSAWAVKLGEKSGRRVGLAITTDTNDRHSRAKSCPPNRVGSLAEVAGFTWVPLQADAAALAAPKMAPMDVDYSDIAQLAGIIANLDLVITVDTALAHLAGAMGKPVWVLLSDVPDWRWMTVRPDSPWYPSARLFRQETPGNWAKVIKAVGAALAETSV